ncbi:MAG: MerR family transcriptional regulator [Acidovorax sp.]|jgi:MerR family transcriptional regulator, copper efflux regulator|uniref:MerR family transcriptional regulator n=1 Tax=Acidovorax sp. TaxID=1872122 RepID=UPI000ACA3E80|nr:MerR family transcriptional regulator [Acidovorax sp.]MDH4425369.1 MerR family transcriptional regulator [Acidovorax sp.]
MTSAIAVPSSTTAPTASALALRDTLGMLNGGASRLSTQTLCQAAGVSRGVLRLYEREGLVPPPARSAAGYRQYPAEEVLRLQAIRGLKELGLTLKEIALLLNEREALAIDTDRLQALAQAQLAAIDTRIARLHMLRKHVAAVSEGDRSAIDDPECHFLLEFLGGGAAVLNANTNTKAKAKAHAAAAAPAPQPAPLATRHNNRTTPKE